MQTFQIHRQSIKGITAQELALVYDQTEFLPYINRVFSKQAFQDVIEAKAKSYSSETRKTLVNSLRAAYASCENNSESVKNIDLLALENTFTITTGHQLSVFTGPLYFVYKILHVIKQCKELKESYPEYNFVPVYWMASEDHDYEEIKSLNLFGKSLTWETNQAGAVGRFNLEGFDELKEALKSFYANHPASEVMQLIDQLNGENYGKLFFKLVHLLFGKYGLVILDGDNQDFKRIFAPIVKEELKSQFSFQAVEKTNRNLVKDGFKLQVNPREINLFYLENGLRNRIIPENDQFSIEGKGKFTLSELNQLVDESPDCFSPNVILRPVYQECILPNVCYVGGLGEMSYWLQLKGVFDHVEIPYPLIQVRNSLLIIDAATSEKMEKLEMTIVRVFNESHVLKKMYLQEHSSEELNFDALDQQVEALKTSLLEKTISVEPNLESYANSEVVKLEKQMAGFKEKLYRQAKSKHDGALKNIDQIKERLFPNDGMQERVVNFFQFCPDGNYSDKIELLMHAMTPFEGDLIVVKI